VGGTLRAYRGAMIMLLTSSLFLSDFRGPLYLRILGIKRLDSFILLKYKSFLMSVDKGFLDAEK
jgi:hypothetical protein